MTFFGRLILVICVSLSATILAVAGTAFFVGEKVGEEIELARVSHLLGTLKQTTEANLAIGLSLDEISSLQPMIEREKADDAGIVVIDIFNAAGISVHSTDRGSIGEQVESAWKTNLARDGIWHGRLRGEAVFGTRFENDLGVAGGIAVTVSGAGRAGRTEVMSMDLAGRAAVLGGGALIVGLVLAVGCAFWLGRPFRRVATLLGGEPAADLGRLDAMDRLAVRVRDNWTATGERMARGQKQLEALDDIE